MKRFVVYNNAGKILRTGGCPDNVFFRQTREGEFVMEGVANGITQKVEFDGLDNKGQPINPRIVNKTSAEIQADNPPPPVIPFEKRLTHINNEQWQDILDRLDKLEIR